MISLPSSVNSSGTWAGRVALLVDVSPVKRSVLLVNHRPGTPRWLPAVVVDTTYAPVRKGERLEGGFHVGERVWVHPEPGHMELGEDEGILLGPDEGFWIVGVMKDPAEVLMRRRDD